MTKDKTAGERQQRLVENNGKKGLVQVKPWIPAHRREEFLALAAQWRAEHLAGGKPS